MWVKPIRAMNVVRPLMVLKTLIATSGSPVTRRGMLTKSLSNVPSLSTTRRTQAPYQTADL